MRHPCSKLWYFCRGLDRQGEGKIVLAPQELERLKESKSTIYRWLREGRELGLFTCYWWQGNTLKVILGGLFKSCIKSQITSWGTAGVVPLEQLLEANGRRAIAIALATQDLQERSRFAAKSQMNRLERRCFDIPTVDQLLNPPTSQKLDGGGTRGVVHLGNSRLFVGRSFIPFGVSQSRVCETLNSQPTSCGVSRWTLRRQLDKLDVTKRQITQAKPEYKEVSNVIALGGASWMCKSDADISFRYVDTGVILLNEPNGNSSSRREGGHRLHTDRLCRYFGTAWVYRCNLYGLSYSLTSMKATRRNWKRSQAAATRLSVPVENSVLTLTPLDPPQEVMPAACSLGSAAGDHIKGSKNDNSQNVETEDISANTGEIPDCWYEAKAKLLKKLQERKQAKLKSLESLSYEPMRDYWAHIYDQ
ncbi:hypothetical protein FACHB389_35945 [Nostoc calcicola FACHB-389]|nr:hypothetical protein FACHB389_35945 [Nostoc calcicola FACHB-389]